MRWRVSSWLLAAGSLVTFLTCGAPTSRPAEGEVGEQMTRALESGSQGFDHTLWHDLLMGGTREGLVDYEFFAERRPDLDLYLVSLAEVDLGSLAPQHLKALLINAYNAFTVLSILERPEVASIRDIDGVWDQRHHRLGGFELALDEIEHNLLRPYFRDPRIHFVVNCASQSCAPLPGWAYDGDSIDEQLEERSRAFLRDSANVRLEGARLLLSRYFDWYADDFSAADWAPREDSVTEFVARYAAPEVAAAIGASPPPRVSFLDYDWDLNRAPSLDRP